jgi:hypothetical protein
MKKLIEYIAERRYWKGYSKGYKAGVRSMMEMIEKFGKATLNKKKEGK